MELHTLHNAYTREEWFHGHSGTGSGSTSLASASGVAQVGELRLSLFWRASTHAASGPGNVGLAGLASGARQEAGSCEK